MSNSTPVESGPESSAEALRIWLADRFGGPVAIDGPVTSSAQGFESAISFVRFSGSGLPAPWREPLVIRVKPTVDGLAMAQREADIQDWVADRDYPAPRVLAVFAPGEIAANPAQAMQRATGDMLLDGVKRAPWTVRQRMRQLAALHVRLHELDPSGFPGATDLLDKRLRLPRSVAETLDDASLRRGLEQIDAMADRLRDAPTVVCHGDFHPLNAIAQGDRMSIIDWSDAALGDRHGDVARTVVLFDLAAMAATNRPERAALRAVGPLLARYYRRAYGTDLDDERLSLWKPVHLIHSWSQATAVRAGLLGGTGHGGSADLASRLPQQRVGDLQRRFESAIAAR